MAEANSIETSPNLFGQETIIHGKVCTQCRIRKPFSEFHWRKQSGRKCRASRCKACAREDMKQRFGTPKARRRKTAYDIKRLYGLASEEYERLRTKQNGCCAICKKPEARANEKYKRIHRLSVDHCHATGKIRGLLCNNCNRGMGIFDDDLAVLRAAVAYLESWQ